MLHCAATSACARPQTPVDTQVEKVMCSGSASYFFIPWSHEFLTKESALHERPS